MKVLHPSTKKNKNNNNKNWPRRAWTFER